MYIIVDHSELECSTVKSITVNYITVSDRECYSEYVLDRPSDVTTADLGLEGEPRMYNIMYMHV